MNIQTLKGFRDFLPEKMIIRNKVMTTLRRVFESYGFEELVTPTLEYAEVLKGKYGEEAERLMYLFQDPGGRNVGLKYDLTVPLARVMAQYPTLPKPFKRFQIQPAFRAENTQKSRYREFYQCDVDTVGTSSLYADGEIIAVISDCLQALGFTDFSIRVNSRKILNTITDSATVLQSLDKLDKKSVAEVKEELAKKGLLKNEIEEIFTKINQITIDSELEEVIRIAGELGAINIKFDPTLVRGLDYYTGTIFESVVTRPKIGSITGGGRYDNLIKSLGGPDMPAVGTTLGLDRICDVIEELNLWPKIGSSTKVLVTIFSSDLINNSLDVSRQLRKSGISCELFPEPVKLDKQLKFASLKQIPFVIVIGPEEAEKKLVVLKNMQTGQQKQITLEECPQEINR